MKHLAVIILLLTLCYYPVAAQQQQARIKLEAENMTKAVVKGDFETVVSYTFPKALAAMGGRQQVLQALNESLKQMKSQHDRIKAIHVGEPGQLFTASEGRFSIVPTKIIHDSNGTNVYSSNPMMAISTDQGKTWYFMDVSHMSSAKMQSLFPNIYNQLLKMIHTPVSEQQW